MSILADPMVTEAINGAFVLTIGIGIRTVWVLNGRMHSLETAKKTLLTRDDFYQEMHKFRTELKGREDDIISRVQYMLDHSLGKK